MAQVSMSTFFVEVTRMDGTTYVVDGLRAVDSLDTLFAKVSASLEIPRTRLSLALGERVLSMDRWEEPLEAFKIGSGANLTASYTQTCSYSRRFTTEGVRVSTTGADHYPVSSFDAFDLKDGLLRGVYSHGFAKPTAIQQCSIRPLIDGRDLVCQCKAGTGNVAAIVIATLQRIDYTLEVCQAMIITPSREVALGISKLVEDIGQHLQPKCAVCIGGLNQRDIVNCLRGGVHVVIGTPGRICTALSTWRLPTHALKTLVFDEADELFFRGLGHSIEDIIAACSIDVQVCFFAAEILAELTSVLATRALVLTREPVKIIAEQYDSELEAVLQLYSAVGDEENVDDEP